MERKLLFSLIGLMTIALAGSRPAPQYEHLIIPYEDAFVPSPEITNQDQPDVWTSYNVGAYTGGDYLSVPLGASYKVGIGSPDQKFKRGSVISLTKTSYPALKRGIVL